MNTSKATTTAFNTFALAFVCCVSASTLLAEDIVPDKFQSDAQINVWVDNASLDLFVSQLAVITGRDASIEGNLQGKVSGRFNGSMMDTLSDVGEQFPVLFDLDDNVLGAVTETERSNATIALGGVALDEQTKTILLDRLLPGNRLDMRNDEVVVSGHPSFVNRIAKTVTLAVARAEPAMAVQATKTSNEFALDVPIASTETDDPSVATDDTSLAIDDASIATDATIEDVQSNDIVIDTASQLILDEAANESLRVGSPETAFANELKTDGILWVTDIPGFETF